MRTSLNTILSAVTGVLVSMVWMSAFGAGSSGPDTIGRVLQRPDRIVLVFAGVVPGIIQMVATPPPGPFSTRSRRASRATAKG